MTPLRKRNCSDTGKVTEILETAIRNGEMKPGERLDCVRNLASNLGVGMTAVMRALDKLEEHYGKGAIAGVEYRIGR